MQLKDFVAETLSQIVQGVSEAQVRVGEAATISPPVLGVKDAASESNYLKTDQGYAQMVRFDIAVNSSSEHGAKGGIGVVAAFVQVGGSASETSETASLNRVQFTVPVILPGGHKVVSTSSWVKPT